MKDGKNQPLILVAVTVLVLAFFLLRVRALLLLPLVFAAGIWLGRRKADSDEDPADWWKKS